MDVHVGNCNWLSGRLDYHRVDASWQRNRSGTGDSAGDLCAGIVEHVVWNSERFLDCFLQTFGIARVKEFPVGQGRYFCHLIFCRLVGEGEADDIQSESKAFRD